MLWKTNNSYYTFLELAPLSSIIKNDITASVENNIRKHSEKNQKKEGDFLSQIIEIK